MVEFIDILFKIIVLIILLINFVLLIYINQLIEKFAIFDFSYLCNYSNNVYKILAKKLITLFF